MPEELSPFTRSNRDLWNVTSEEYQRDHHTELKDDVLWGPSMPPEAILRVLGASVAAKDVLEICCGGGQCSMYLAEKGARAVGVDLSSKQLEHARRFAEERHADVRFVESNAEDLSMFADASFDVAFSAYALGFVQEVDRTFREAFRVLRPGGLFAFSWSSPFYVCLTRDKDGALRVTRSYFDRSPIVFTDENGREVDFYRTYGDWLRSLVDAGFVVTDILEPEPLPQESTYSDVFPLDQVRQVPGTVIWRARKPE
ncbi:MAG TPA: methyltransferase domain-containing protein [Thermoplasmata archaeon]|nr:methyltransferase domain-containing protein [Thermoplasmata archaeon]